MFLKFSLVQIKQFAHSLSPPNSVLLPNLPQNNFLACPYSIGYIRWEVFLSLLSHTLFCTPPKELVFLPPLLFNLILSSHSLGGKKKTKKKEKTY